MAKSDANLHRIDLLLTLDYLLNHTNENHPATQIKICEYARKFGLNYDKKNTTGNDVDRRRISASLEFLHNLTNSNQADKIPFKVEKTEGGKYFISTKFSLEKEEIIKILSSLQNDKYIKKQETDTLIEKLLNIFVNEQSREEYKKELSINDREVRKINPTFNRKMRLVNKAYKEGKMIKIGHKIYVDNKNFLDATLNSAGKDLLEEFMYNTCYKAMLKFVNAVPDAKKLHINDRKSVVRFYASAYSNSIIYYLANYKAKSFGGLLNCFSFENDEVFKETVNKLLVMRGIKK